MGSRWRIRGRCQQCRIVVKNYRESAVLGASHGGFPALWWQTGEGSYGNILNFSNLNSTELCDPATGAWSPTGSLGMARQDHSAILLANGKIMRAAGGIGVTALGTAELYNFSRAGSARAFMNCCCCSKDLSQKHKDCTLIHALPGQARFCLHVISG